MLRNLVSVDWTGKLYDCDFNQMLELGVAPELPQTIADFDPVKFGARRIMTGSHCFGCAAGAGSSCGGEGVVIGWGAGGVIGFERETIVKVLAEFVTTIVTLFVAK